MAAGGSRVDAALDLARLSLALADALETGDVETAERLVVERTRVLDGALAVANPADPRDVTALAEARVTVVAADRRSQVALRQSVEATHAELGALAHGARAMRAYLPAEPLAPGYVDRHD